MRGLEVFDPCQVSHHESGNAASSAYDTAAKDISDLDASLKLQTEEQLRVKRMRHMEKEAAEVSSIAGSALMTDQEEGSMSFSSFAGPRIAMMDTAGDASPASRRGPSTYQSFDAENQENPMPPRSADNSGPSTLRQWLPPHPDTDEDMPQAKAAEVGAETPPPVQDPSGTKRSRKQKEKASALQRLQTLFIEKMETFKDSALWNNKIKSRAVETACKQLEDAAEKANSDSSAAAQTEIEKVLEFTEVLKQKFQTFANVRKWSTFLESSLNTEVMAMLNTIQPAVLAQVMMWLCQEVTKAVDQDRWPF